MSIGQRQNLGLIQILLFLTYNKQRSRWLEGGWSPLGETIAALSMLRMNLEGQYRPMDLTTLAAAEERIARLLRRVEDEIDREGERWNEAKMVGGIWL